MDNRLLGCAFRAGLLALSCLGSAAIAQIVPALPDSKTIPMEKPGSSDCPAVQPAGWPQPRTMDDDGMVPTESGGSCGSSEIVDGYFGIYLPAIEPTVPYVPAIGPDVIAGITYNSGIDSHCVTTNTLTGCSDDSAWLGDKFWLNSRPQMVVWTPSGETLKRITVYSSSKGRYTFCQSANDTKLYYGVNGCTGVIDVVTLGAGSHDVYRLHQRNGDILWFFGPSEVSVTVWESTSSSNVTAQTRLSGQLWKITHDNGKSASDQPKMYVSASTASDPSVADAYTGFQLCHSGSNYFILPRVKTMFGSGGRKYEYTYASDRLSTIAVSDAASSTALSTTTFHYFTGSSSHGASGTLQAIEVAEVVRPGSSTLAQTRIQYFRHGTVNMTGSPEVMKFTLAPEGVRRYCIDNSVTYPGGALAALESASDSTLHEYSASFAEYYDSTNATGGEAWKQGRVREVTVNGQCGCGGGGGASSTYTYDYTRHVSGGVQLDPDTDGTYDCSGQWWAASTPHWRMRTKVTQPDGTYRVTFFDDTARELAVVLCAMNPDTDPSSSGQCYWATVYQRDDNTRVEYVYAPETVATFNPSTGAFTFDSTKGVIQHYVYAQRPGVTTNEKFLSGKVVKQVDINDGSSGAGFCVQKSYIFDTTVDGSGAGDWCQNIGGGSIGDQARLAVPKVTAVRVYKDDSGSSYDETQYDYKYWGTPWALKRIITTPPVVPTTENGPGSSITVNTTQWLDQQSGKVAFASNAAGVLTYYEYSSSTGQLVRRVDDPDSSVSGASTAASAFGSVAPTVPTSGSGPACFCNATTWEYDLNGRLRYTTLPTARKAYTFYTLLGTQEWVTLSGPKATGSGSGEAFYGPVGMSVSNMAGRTTAQLTLTLGSGSGLTEGSIASWISTSATDPVAAVTAVTTGSPAVARVSTSLYHAAGSRLDASRLYTAWGSSLSSGASYDETLYKYDGMGRVLAVKDPTGTVRQTLCDARGRAKSQWIGLNDNDSTTFSQRFSSTGSSDMTETTRSQYVTLSPTSGSYAIGTSRLSKSIQDPNGQGDWTSSNTDLRETSYLYDYRSRLVVVIAPESPHRVSKYDFLGRSIAQGIYGSHSGLSASTDPTSTSTNRLGLSESQYDARGRVWKATTHKVVQSGGSAGTYSSSDDLHTLTWLDTDGNVLKTTGPSGLIKYAYDRLDRRIRSYSLATQNDTAYADADGVTGDIVLEEGLTNYDASTGRPTWSMTLSRVHHNTSTTGVLDSSGQPNASLARASISAVWYDDLDRVTTSATYGTNTTVSADDGPASGNGGSFSYPSSAPGSSAAPSTAAAGVLVTTTAFNRDGTVGYTVDPVGRKTATLYDKTGRTKATIANYDAAVSSGATPGSTLADKHVATTNIYTRYKYENGLLRYMWVDVAGSLAGSESPPTSFTGDDADDQVTEYIYSTTKGSPGAGTSRIASHALLSEMKYPDGSDSGHLSVQHAYNALGEQVWTKDQNQTVIETEYDRGGRQTARKATSVNSSLDSSVLRIGLAYTNRGQVSSVTQYSDTSGSSVYNQVAYTYDDWGSASQIDQDPDSAVGASGIAAFSVQFGYTRAVPSGGRTAVRRTSLTYPEGWKLNFKYSSSSSLDDAAGRVTSMTYTLPTGSPPPESTNRVEYQYLGEGQLVSTLYNEPARASRMHDGASTPGYDHLDPFGRLVQNDWVRSNNNPAPAYDVRLIYDLNSNITRIKDLVLHDLSDDLAYSTDYTMDNLNRVAQANRGIVDGTSIIGADRWNELWQLSHTGNWVSDKIDLDGDSAYTSSGELNETRTHNKINEITTKGSVTAIAYNASGELVDDGSVYQYQYDAFGRMIKVFQRNSTRYAGTLISQYRYDGLGQRVGWRSNSTGITSSDPWFHFVYDDRWRIIETFRGNSGHTARDTNPKERFVMHNAGRDGLGASSYIDMVAWMDRDLSVDWRSAAGDGNLETRHYYCQNWRADTVTLLGLTTVAYPEWLPQRHYRYSAYGRRIEIAQDDFNRDGIVNSFDLDDFEGVYSGQERCDITYDGFIDAYVGGFDDDALYNMIADGTRTEQTTGGGVRSLFSGYQLDPAVSGTPAATEVLSARARMFIPEMGTWTRVDPLGYVDGVNLFEYVRSDPLVGVDPEGTSSAHPGGRTSPFATGGCCGPDVTQWFLDELKIHLQYFGPGGRAHSVASQVKKLMLFYHYATLIPYKWMNFGSDNEGPCKGSVEICGRCIHKSDLGNIMYGAVGASYLSTSIIPADKLVLHAGVLGGKTGGIDSSADLISTLMGIRLRSAKYFQSWNITQFCASLDDSSWNDWEYRIKPTCNEKITNLGKGVDFTHMLDSLGNAYHKGNCVPCAGNNVVQFGVVTGRDNVWNGPHSDFTGIDPETLRRVPQSPATIWGSPGLPIVWPN